MTQCDIILFLHCVTKFLLYSLGSHQQQKNGLFMVRLTVRGGTAPSALTVSKYENFGLFFPIIKW